MRNIRAAIVVVAAASVLAASLSGGAAWAGQGDPVPVLGPAVSAPHPLSFTPTNPPPKPDSQALCDSWNPGYTPPPVVPGTGSVGTQLVLDDPELRFLPRALATLVQFDASGAVISENSKYTCSYPGAVGADVLWTNLAPGTYWLYFTAGRASLNMLPRTIGGWYGASFLNPFGSPVTVVADQKAETSQARLTRTGDLTGTVRYGATDAPFDAASLRVELAIYNAGTNAWNPIAETTPAADGTFSWPYLQPGPYRVFVKYSGDAGTAPVSFTRVVDVASLTTTTVDVLTRHLVDGVDGVSPPTNAQVNALYWDYLTRLPSANEVSHWGMILQSGVSSSAVSDGFVNSDEYRLIRIDAAYQSILGRAADQPGRVGWLANMKAGRITTDDIETQFYASAEYYASHGGSDVSFVASLYQNLLHRSGGDAEYAGWVNQIAAHGRQWVVNQFWRSNETIGERVSAMYAFYLGRVPDAEGLQNWVDDALLIGDSGLRSGLTSSGEYFDRSQYRFLQR